MVVTGESPFLVASLAYAIYSLTEAYNPEEYNSVPMQGFFGELIKIFFLINNMELLLKKTELLTHKTVALHSDVNEVLQKLKGQLQFYRVEIKSIKIVNSKFLFRSNSPPELILSPHPHLLFWE